MKSSVFNLSYSGDFEFSWWFAAVRRITWNFVLLHMQLMIAKVMNMTQKLMWFTKCIFATSTGREETILSGLKESTQYRIMRQRLLIGFI